LWPLACSKRVASSVITLRIGGGHITVISAAAAGIIATRLATITATMERDGIAHLVGLSSP
jgi:hypothetical protein